MALFGRHHLPALSTLSRFLAALTKPATEALRTLFLADLLARPPSAASARSVGLQIAEAKSGSPSISMGHVRPPVNELCQRQRIGLRQSFGWGSCAHLAT